MIQGFGADENRSETYHLFSQLLSLWSLNMDSIFTYIRTLSDDQRANALAQTKKIVPHFEKKKSAENLLEPHTLCALHQKMLIGLCTVCNKPVCNKCSECVERHSILPISDMISAVFPTDPSARAVEAIAGDLQENLGIFRDRVAAAERDFHEAERTERTAAERLASMTAQRSYDLAELERLRGVLGESHANVGTDAAKEAIANARKRLCITERLDNEIKRCSRAHAASRLMVAKARVADARLRGDLLRAEFAADLHRFPELTPQRASFAFAMQSLNAVSTIPVKRAPSSGPLPAGKRQASAAPHTGVKVGNPADATAEFSAFDGVRSLSWMRKLLASGLLQANNLFVSKDAAHVASLPPSELGYHNLHLSLCGTLCAQTSRKSNGADSELLLYNFTTGRSAMMKVPRLLWACVCDDQLFLGIYGAATIRHAPLTAAFDGLLAERFAEFPVPDKVYMAATDRAADGWIVFLSAFKKELVRVDLRAKTCAAIACDRAFYAIGPLAGVRVPGALCAARELGGEEATLVVLTDGHVTAVARGLEGVPTILPSATHPNDLSAAAVIDCRARMTFGGHTDVLSFPVRPHWRSLVRLYRDVFLCFCEASRSWHALRIAVP
eukprot:gnl/Chilomastix_cuspidata/106.p1 GENE.gnl/Chilomastix_cuspidata/106~~gnl/Chilomastix_cuspidata/106.p1  ORF type:complete len:614 (-),score=154.59 gnl/Chilomastix_cuspidata/106:818-2659(-)